MRQLTSLCFLLLLLGKLFLLALPLLFVTPSFTVESTLSTPRPRSDPRLSRHGAALSHLTIWCFGLRALFLFLLAKAALAYLPTALSLAPRPFFPSQQAQYAQFIYYNPRHSASSLLVSATPTSLPLVFSIPVLTLVQCSPFCPLLHLSFYLNLSGKSSASRALCNSSYISYPLFSPTGCVLSHLKSSAHRFPRFPPRNLCSLVTLAVYFLSSTLQRTQLSVKLLSLQDW